MRISDWSSDVCSSDLAEVTGQDGCEVGIAFRCEHREAVSGEPEQQPRDPLLKPQPHRGGECAVEDRDPARRAAEQDRLGERPVQRHFEAVDGTGAHQTSAPPPKLQKDRKKLDAAKATARPNTIWISRSAERRVGNTGVRPGISRWTP